MASTPQPTPIPPTPKSDSVPKPLTKEEIKSIAGDLKHGELGFVELDDHGKPTGAAKREMPEPGKSVARVVGHAPPKFDEALTPTGAPITAQMNPALDFYDPALVERNPIPKEPKK